MNRHPSFLPTLHAIADYVAPQGMSQGRYTLKREARAVQGLHSVLGPPAGEIGSVLRRGVRPPLHPLLAAVNDDLVDLSSGVGGVRPPLHPLLTARDDALA